MPPAHQRVSFTGILLQASGGGQEIFSFGFASDTSGSEQTLAEALAAVAGTQWGGGSSNVQGSYYAGLASVVVESIAADGKVTGSYRADVPSAPVSGLNTSMNLTVPCMAITLETGVQDSKGSKVRGRMYPPAQASQPFGSTVQLSAANDYRDGWKVFMQAMVAAGAVPAVASSTSAGLVHVTGITVDTVIDTQRRRKNHVTRQRTTVATL
uniref:Uncharacterized protein n=1 Tax=uncultured prokaryote TaxID=198431 RepID=A0A0H5Q292_9ZZZZ|nr:hypothetical protein [uncultured prokaryote]